MAAEDSQLDGNSTIPPAGGLTKCEYFAALILQGAIATSNNINRYEALLLPALEKTLAASALCPEGVNSWDFHRLLFAFRGTLLRHPQAWPVIAAVLADRLVEALNDPEPFLLRVAQEVREQTPYQPPTPEPKPTPPTLYAKIRRFLSGSP